MKYESVIDGKNVSVEAKSRLEAGLTWRLLIEKSEADHSDPNVRKYSAESCKLTQWMLQHGNTVSVRSYKDNSLVCEIVERFVKSRKLPRQRYAYDNAFWLADFDSRIEYVEGMASIPRLITPGTA